MVINQQQPGRLSAVVVFIATFAIGWLFFLLPVYVGGKWTVPFDVFVTGLRKAFPVSVAWFTFILTIGGAAASLLSLVKEYRPALVASLVAPFKTNSWILFFRVIGAILAVVYFTGMEPAQWQKAHIGALIWGVLAISVALIIPLGAMIVQLFVEYGGMEFLGVLSRPFMQPLFRLPGRAALDALASWVGSYSVGLYITRTVFHRGGYSRRDVTIIATCFSTVSIGFVGVVAATLDLLPFFPILIGFYFIAIVGLTAILVRMPPISRKPHTRIDGKPMEDCREVQPSLGNVFKTAWQAGIAQAQKAAPVSRALPKAFVDGLMLAASILSTIISVGTLALVVAHFTPVFQWIGQPIGWLLKQMAIPGAQEIAPAVLVEITEMYIPALLVTHAPLPGRFFIAVLSVSQLIFFSSLGPMILEMFQDVPITLKDLLILFLLRTAILLPFLALGVHGLMALGVL